MSAVEVLSYIPYLADFCQKLISKEYCERIKPLFGVGSIPELKELISKTYIDNSMRYNNGSRIAPTILSSIKTDDIATMI